VPTTITRVRAVVSASVSGGEASASSQALHHRSLTLFSIVLVLVVVLVLDRQTAAEGSFSVSVGRNGHLITSLTVSLGAQIVFDRHGQGIEHENDDEHENDAEEHERKRSLLLH
jgi:hypothetical protein